VQETPPRQRLCIGSKGLDPHKLASFSYHKLDDIYADETSISWRTLTCVSFAMPLERQTVERPVYIICGRPYSNPQKIAPQSPPNGKAVVRSAECDQPNWQRYGDVAPLRTRPGGQTGYCSRMVSASRHILRSAGLRVQRPVSVATQGMAHQSPGSTLPSQQKCIEEMLERFLCYDGLAPETNITDNEAGYVYKFVYMVLLPPPAFFLFSRCFPQWS
jgi:hypothetical protein